MDYAAINAQRIEVRPRKEVLYLSGPMTHCKSEPHMEEADQNFAAFNNLEACLVARGHEVLNPARVEVSVRDDAEAAQDPVLLWQACLKKDLCAMILTGVTRIVFLPPAYTVHSTPERPHLRHWSDSSGVCLEVFFGLKLGCAFSQASRDAHGNWLLAEISHEQVRATLSRSQTFADLQRDHSGPFTPQGGQPLPEPISDALPLWEEASASFSVSPA